MKALLSLECTNPSRSETGGDSVLSILYEISSFGYKGGHFAKIADHQNLNGSQKNILYFFFLLNFQPQFVIKSAEFTAPLQFEPRLAILIFVLHDKDVMESCAPSCYYFISVQ